MLSMEVVEDLEAAVEEVMECEVVDQDPMTEWEVLHLAEVSVLEVQA